MKIKNIIALLIGITAGMIMCEIILQVLDFPSRPVSGWKNCKIKNPGECNSLGFRGKEITYSSDDYIVLLVGDSEVYAPAIPFEQRPENRLEHYLKSYKNNIKVFTVGDMGYGQDQQYLALKEYFEKYRADMVLLMFTERNDVEDNMFPTSGLNNTLKPTFWLENGQVKGPTQGLLDPVGSRFKLALLWHRYVDKNAGESYLKQWIKDKLPAPYKPQNSYHGKVDYSWHKIWLTDPEHAYKNIGFEKEGPANQFAPRSRMREYGYNLTRKLFSKIKRLVENHNGHFIIFKEERPWERRDTEMEKAYFLNGRYFRVSMKQYQKNLKDLFSGFEFYEIPLNMDQVTVNEKDAHLSHEAIDKLMKELARIIGRKGYFLQNH